MYLEARGVGDIAPLADGPINRTLGGQRWKHQILGVAVVVSTGTALA